LENTLSTGDNRDNREGNPNLCSLCSLLFKSEADFLFVARDTTPALPGSDGGGWPCIYNRLSSIASAAKGPLLVATKPELHEYKCVHVQNDAEIGLFSDEVVVNCAP